MIRTNNSTFSHAGPFQHRHCDRGLPRRPHDDGARALLHELQPRQGDAGPRPGGHRGGHHRPQHEVLADQEGPHPGDRLWSLESLREIKKKMLPKK